MKILLISQVPAEFEAYKAKGQIFPVIQAQSHWITGLKNLNHLVKVFLYSQPVLLPLRLNLIVVRFTKSRFSNLYQKYRLVKNKIPWIFPDNILKSLSLTFQIIHLKPKVVFFSGGISELVGLEWLVLKSLKIKTVLLHGVDPQVGATGYEKANVKMFDLIVTNSHEHAKGWKKMGAKKSICLPYSGIDPDYHQPLTSQKTKGVVFAGTLFGDRVELFSQLIKAGVDLEIYGNLPPEVTLPDIVRQHYHGQVWGEDLLFVLSAAQIALNPLPDHMRDGANLRMFEIAACNTLQLTSYTDPNWFVDTKDLVVYKNSKDLVTKINFYLQHPQEAINIATSGRRKVTDYSYQQRFQDIINLLNTSNI